MIGLPENLSKTKKKKESLLMPLPHVGSISFYFLFSSFFISFFLFYFYLFSFLFLSIFILFVYCFDFK